MALSIKSPKTHALARQLASLTGESITEAVTVALQERTARLRADKGWLTNRLLEIGRDSAARIPEHLRSVDHGDLLYDERGLPR